VAARSSGEAGRAGSGVRGQRLQSELELAGEGGRLGAAVLLESRAAVVAQAGLGEVGELRASASAAVRAVPGSTTRVARPKPSASAASTGRPVRIMSRARPVPISRGSRTLPPSISGTPHRPAEDPEDGVGRDDAQVAPDGELQPAGDGVALDRARSPAWSGSAGSGPSGRRPRWRPVAALGADGVEVGAGAEVAARAVEDGDVGLGVGVEPRNASASSPPSGRRRRCGVPGGS
jgi:hypothetical protein